MRHVAHYDSWRRFLMDVTNHAREVGPLAVFDDPEARLLGWASEQFGYRIPIQTVIRQSRYVPHPRVLKAIREQCGEDLWKLLLTLEGRQKLGAVWGKLPPLVLRYRPRPGVEAGHEDTGVALHDRR